MLYYIVGQWLSIYSDSIYKVPCVANRRYSNFYILIIYYAAILIMMLFITPF